VNMGTLWLLLRRGGPGRTRGVGWDVLWRVASCDLLLAAALRARGGVWAETAACCLPQPLNPRGALASCSFVGRRANKTHQREGAEPRAHTPTAAQPPPPSPLCRGPGRRPPPLSRPWRGQQHGQQHGRHPGGRGRGCLGSRPKGNRGADPHVRPLCPPTTTQRRVSAPWCPLGAGVKHTKVDLQLSGSMYMYLGMYLHRHARAHTHTHTHSLTPAHKDTHTHTHAHTHSHTHAPHIKVGGENAAHAHRATAGRLRLPREQPGRGRRLCGPRAARCAADDASAAELAPNWTDCGRFSGLVKYGFSWNQWNQARTRSMLPDNLHLHFI